MQLLLRDRRRTQEQSRVLSDAAIDYVLARLEDEIEKRFAALHGEINSMQRRKTVLEAELKNLSRAIADGMDSPSIRAAITERETEISAITSKTLGQKKRSVHAQVKRLRRFVRDSVGDIRALLAGKHAAGHYPAGTRPTHRLDHTTTGRKRRRNPLQRRVEAVRRYKWCRGTELHPASLG